ncbi:MAG: quinolinate synthase NadA [Deltaproteobacteria bacterium]|nr:quinolinate synthase NadA [Deltaproteobacteria bacterium]MBI4794525.1 quinolinate synthase NadA [Deltaproteobacteria bacterium]
MKLTAQQQEVRDWLEKRRAILLAHNYQPGEIQDIADVVGDSLELSMKAAQTTAEVIVFCGVHFMAETAAILCPDKTVLLPRLDVGCCLAESVTAAKLLARKAELPGVPVVTYVNSTAAVKAESDICCTSANAISVVNSLAAPRVLMIPDQNLALYAARHTAKEIEILTWEGWCNVHDGLSAEEVLEAKAAHPQAVFIAHPECNPEVVDLADFVRSTSGMLKYVQEAEAKEFIIGTEKGILHRMRKENPAKVFYSPSKRLICRPMKRITLADVITALQENRHQITVPEDIRVRALNAVERMLAVPRD